MRKTSDALTFRSHKTGLCCTAQFVALALVVALSGCTTAGLFTEFDLAEDPAVADTPWPRLIDVPRGPEPGTFTRSIPDPLNGDRTQAALSVAAVAAAERADELSGPVISEEEQADLVLGYVINQEVRSLEAERAAAEEKKLAEDEARRKANALPVEQSGAGQVPSARMDQ